MSFPYTPTTADHFQRAKRKLDDDDYDYDYDYDGADFSDLRMKNDPDFPPITHYFTNQQFNQSPRVSTSQESLSNYHDRIQFFVRLISEAKTLVLYAKPNDQVQVIHEKIQSITGIPMIEQRLIYCGRQLQWETSLADCKINNDASLHLVGRMRSTEHLEVWEVINDFVSLIYRLYKGETDICFNLVKSNVEKFVEMTCDENITEDTLVSHLNIFQSLCAPRALVMLYISSQRVNNESAVSLIKYFVESFDQELGQPLCFYCAPVVLDLCNVLRGTVGQDDPLYLFCRANLGSIVEDLRRIGRRSRNYDDKNCIVAVEDIFPFVTELVNDLNGSLSFNNANPSSSTVCDFAKFLGPIKAAIKDVPEYGGVIPVPITDTLPCYDDEIRNLFMILFELLEKVRNCLKEMEGQLATEMKKDNGWDQYLALLKELHGIAKLYQDAEGIFWSDMKLVKVSLNYLIVNYAKRDANYKWICGRNDILDFKSRWHLAMMLLPEIDDEYDEIHEMLIDRSNLLAESFEYIAHKEPEKLRGGLFMGFKSEEATGPGVLREWFFLVCQEIFNPQNALFVACPNDRRRFFPNPASKVDPLHCQYFKFAGRVIALALMHKLQVGIVFDRSFFVQLAGADISLEDIKDADPYLYSSCKKILDMDPIIVDQDALGLTFVHEIEELGSMKVMELFANGKNIVVNSRNRKDYVELLIKHRFGTSVKEQVTQFANGFADITVGEYTRKLFFKSLELEDLDGMLHGSESNISVEDWKLHTEYSGYKETDPQICWFWQIVGEMTDKQQMVLLFFWTAMKHLPVEGFGGLASKLYIYKSNDSIDLLPSSHTCFYRICFPAYPSMAVMRERLNIITQDHVCCSFGTW